MGLFLSVITAQHHKCSKVGGEISVLFEAEDLTTCFVNWMPGCLFGKIGGSFMPLSLFYTNKDFSPWQHTSFVSIRFLPLSPSLFLSLLLPSSFSPSLFLYLPLSPPLPSVHKLFFEFTSRLTNCEWRIASILINWKTQHILIDNSLSVQTFPYKVDYTTLPLQ